MNQACPICGSASASVELATGIPNEWKYSCGRCDIRFDEKGRIRDSEGRIYEQYCCRPVAEGLACNVLPPADQFRLSKLNRDLQEKIAAVVNHELVQGELKHHGRFGQRGYPVAGVDICIVSDRERWMRSDTEEFYREMLRRRCTAPGCGFSQGHTGEHGPYASDGAKKCAAELRELADRIEGIL